MLSIRHNPTEKYLVNVTEQFSNTRLALFSVAWKIVAWSWQHYILLLHMKQHHTLTGAQMFAGNFLLQTKIQSQSGSSIQKYGLQQNFLVVSQQQKLEKKFNSH